MTTDAVALKTAIADKYGKTARSGLSSEHEGARKVAEAFGYSAGELGSIPAAANMGLSCGNPVATASLRPGETVLDLGCGGGLDVFLAAQKVGPDGRAIGLDMTEDMLARANANLARTDFANVRFVAGEIEDMPLEADSIDCVISNCVLNLVPDKDKAFAEIFRVLRPGGRLAVSDIALKKPLPEELAGDLMAYVGCIAGAIALAEYQSGLQAAGFADVKIVDDHADLNAYALADDQAVCCTPTSVELSGGLTIVDDACCTPAEAAEDAALHTRLADLLRRHDVNDYAASVKVYAVKP